MVGELFQDGVAVGTLSLSDDAFAHISQGRSIELRTNDGKPVLTLEAEPYGALKSNAWDEEISPEELERLLAEPSFTYEEIKLMPGWK